MQYFRPRHTLFLSLTLIISLFTQNVKANPMNIKNNKDSLFQVFYNNISGGNLDAVKGLIESEKIKIAELNTSSNPWITMSYTALSGNRQLFDYLLAKGGDVKLADESGETALHWTAWQGNLEASKWLVEKGADVNAYYRANGGLTPLCCAAESGNMDLVKYLVAEGADSFFEDKSSGSSPLRSAAYKGHYEVFKYFADQQPQNYDWQMVLIYGIIGSSLDIVKYAVQKGADVNKKARYWELPIHEAASQWFGEGEESVKIIKYLQSKGALLKDINDGDIFPWALERCSQEVIDYLLEQGIKLKFSDEESRGWTPLALSLDKGSMVVAKNLLGKKKEPTFREKPLVIFFADGMYNSPQIIDFLIKNGANTKHYTEAFFLSAQCNDLESVKLLLAAGANINHTDDNGLNALYYSHNPELSKYLIEKGIDLTNKKVLEASHNNFVLVRILINMGIELPVDQESLNMALQRAAQVGDIDLVKFFLQKGADVNSGTKTALIQNTIQGYESCGYNYDAKNKSQVSPDVARILIDAGADINHKDDHGRAALHYAAGDQYCRIGIEPIPIGSRLDRERGAHGDPAMPAMQHHDKILELLIQTGSDIDTKDNEGNTPLLLAMKSNNMDAFKLLSKAGADLKAENNDGKSIMNSITDVNMLNEIKSMGLLSSIPQEVISNLFSQTYYDGRYGENTIDKLKILIECGADINKPFDDFDKATMLMKIYTESYYSNRDEVIKFLLENGADLQAKDRRGRTALFYAVDNSNAKLEEIEYLIGMGANVNDADDFCTKPYMIAAFEGRKDIAELLEKHGSTPDYEAEWWYNLQENFHTALDRIPVLVAKGIDVNMKAAYPVEPNSSHGIDAGMTALMFFSKLISTEGIKKLLDLGADVNVRDNEGHTALYYAKKTHYEGKNEAIKMLQDAGGIE